MPKTIALVRSFINAPGATSKRAAFAMLKTIENLVSGILRHALNLVEKTIVKTEDALSSTASKVIVALLTSALIGASGIGSAAIHAGAPWLSQAAEIVQKQIEKLAE